MTTQTTPIAGTVARIEWERLHNAVSAVMLFTDGRIVHVHSQSLGEHEHDHLLLTREGDAIEAMMAQDPEPHVCRYTNRSVADMAKPGA